MENDNAEIATAEEQSSGAERLAELSRARKEVQVGERCNASGCSSHSNDVVKCYDMV